MEKMDRSCVSGIYIAPLQIKKERTLKKSNSFGRAQRTSVTGATKRHSRSKSPSPSPSRSHRLSKESLQCQSPHQDGIFYSFLRAFCSFHPTCDEDSSTVTLPLNKGDVILVHSVHTNGWADGTLLTSGARGWLPTNYCEGYFEEPSHVLMKALTIFWDMVRGSSKGNTVIFGNQDYVRGLVAGVRCLLVSRALDCDAGFTLAENADCGNDFAGENRMSHQRFADGPILPGFTPKSQSPIVRSECSG